MKKLIRLWRNFLIGPWAVRRQFSKEALQHLTDLVKASEKLHSGELRFAIEDSLDLRLVCANRSPREQAIQVFSDLRIWDTEENNGVLIYVLMSEHDIEIVADRGISAKVPQGTWDSLCRNIEKAFREGNFESGLQAGLEEVTQLLAKHFPPSEEPRNEIPDKPAIL